jgi:hypothetical protein
MTRGERLHRREHGRSGADPDLDAPAAPTVGKRTLVDTEHGLAARARAAASEGVRAAAEPLPHLAEIQRAFGRFDVTGVRAQVGGGAADAIADLGGEAYAFGDRVAFASAPDLFMAAHEAAHVVQQRAGVHVDGGMGRAGDRYEREADEVAQAVVRGESAEPLLARMTGGAQSTSVTAPVVQQWDPSELSARQARQPWETATFDGPLADHDPTVETAVRANQALGFTSAQINALRQALGLHRDPSRIEGRFVQAVRRLQRDGVVTPYTERDGTNGTTHERPADIAASGSVTGILDEVTVMMLDLSREVEGDVRQTYRRPPWSQFTVAEIDDLRVQLTERFALTADDLVALPRNGARPSPHFLERVAAWQLWNDRGRPIVYGRLGRRELSELGTGVAYTPRPERAPRVEGADPAPPVVGPMSRAPDVASPAAPDADVAPVADEATRLAQVRAARDELRTLLRRYQTAHRAGDAAARDAAVTTLTARITTLREEISNLELPRTDFTGSSRYRADRPWNVARRMIEELDYILDPADPPSAMPMSPAAEAAAEASPLERRDAAASLAHLREEGVVVREGASHEVTRWDPRVGDRGDPADVRARGERNIAALEALQGRMTPHRTALAAALPRGVRERDLDHGALTRALEALALEDFGHQEAWQPPATGEADVLRNPFSPGTRPSPLLVPGSIPLLEPAVRVRRARAWLRWLNGANSAIGDGTSRGELRRQRGYAHNDPTSYSGSGLVELDLHRTGVTVTNNGGNPLPTSEMRLDPQFGDAMLRFLREVQSLGVTEIRTAGFLRPPASTMDTHPRGQACDITGFQIGDQLLHLRSGQPMDPPAPGDAAAMARYMDLSRGHSDWFDHTGTIRGMTHEEVFHAITNLMRSYFSRIIGPGNDRRHMGHWHVELTANPGTGPQVHAQMLDRDQRTETTDAADRRSPGWRTPSETASFPDDEELD